MKASALPVIEEDTVWYHHGEDKYLSVKLTDEYDNFIHMNQRLRELKADFTKGGSIPLHALPDYNRFTVHVTTLTSEDIEYIETIAESISAPFPKNISRFFHLTVDISLSNDEVQRIKSILKKYPDTDIEIIVAGVEIKAEWYRCGLDC